MKLLMAASCAGVLMASSAFGATVLNGSFETGAVSLNGQGWGITNTLTNWTVGPGGVEIQTNPTLGNINAQNGGRYVELDSTVNSYIEQLISFTSAGTYKLEFWYSSIRNADGIMAEIGSNRMMLTTQGATGWQKITLGFSSNGSTPLMLRFSATGPSGGLGGLLDNVSITQLTAVPLPATGLMLLAGLGGFAALRRKAKDAA